MSNDLITCKKRLLVLSGGFLATLLLTLFTAANGAQARGLVALTFDDGPHAYLTPRILNILRRERVPATFYVTGWRVRKWPGIARRIVREGHEIGNHGWSHRALSRLSNAAIRHEIVRTEHMVRRVTGVTPRMVRPPFGAVSRRVRRAAGRALACWHVDSLDWRRQNTGRILHRVLRLTASRRNAVILLHDTIPATARALPQIIRALKRRGYRFVRASRLRAPCLAPHPRAKPRKRWRHKRQRWNIAWRR